MPDVQLGLDYIADDSLTGYRLERLEVLNWGTFDRRVWSLELGGRNTLLTGDIGTGKSTLVDAVTTLLVPPNRVAYNKAAGAAYRERTLRSYVMGYYKAERGESGHSSARPVALRDIGTYSVVLGVFKNVGYMQTVTLAQVFWPVESTRQPKRFYVAAECEMSIRGDFSRFGKQISGLRRKLRRGNASIWDTFPPYGAWFRRRFGIHDQQALDLFHQTVSMKSVGNLTSFVRQHMLEEFDSSSRIDALISHFDDLTASHDAVLRAKRQIALLTPLIEKCDRYDALEAKTQQWRRCEGALEPYFAELKSELLEERIASATEARARQEAEVARCEAKRQDLADRERELVGAIAEKGGDRLSSLDSSIRRRREELDRQRRKARDYARLLRLVDEGQPAGADEFLAQRHRVEALGETLRERRQALSENLVESRVLARTQEDSLKDLAREIQSLRSRRSNIPSSCFELRRRMCEALGLDERLVPFAGELIAVRPEASRWEGALERLLRGFSLSVLVPDKDYAGVANWVDSNHLDARLTYSRLQNVLERRRRAARLHRDSAVKKLEVRSDSSLASWIERELVRRFNVPCCRSAEDFQREPSAVTSAGQIKHSGVLNEKDDRYRIDDRSRYVLGWTNASKIRALESTERSLKRKLAALHQEIHELKKEVQAVDKQIDTLSSLRGITDFRDIDWHSTSREIVRLRDERRALRSASDILERLSKQLATVKKEAMSAESAWMNATKALEKVKARLDLYERSLKREQELLRNLDLQSLQPEFSELTEIRTASLGIHELTLRKCDQAFKLTTRWLRDQILKTNNQSRRILYQIIRSMNKYNGAFGLDSSEVDASIESAPEYRRMLKRLKDDDLPSFESRFKQLLNENTIREIANFQARLDRERGTIREKIGRINTLLSQIEFNRGRYIRIEDEPTVDREVHEFRRDLRKCTQGALIGSEDDQYSEEKFREVKTIIDRFRGREGSSENDLRWTAKVTDVRNWFVFGASERRLDDDSEFEHYSDTSGKSGGQKEKLAYTILAASLTYQFGLEWGASRSRAFRFVVIDEAFGRGSDESTQYALTLFSKLNLQLLIVTPLQKIYVIESFVESVGFIDIRNDRESKLRNLTVKQYFEEKRRAEEQRAVHS